MLRDISITLIFTKYSLSKNNFNFKIIMIPSIFYFIHILDHRYRTYLSQLNFHLKKDQGADRDLPNNKSIKEKSKK